jgi:UDP-4-amino-4,6-dideoxy-N-acetyl-beta-L-altrosamine N-acetyltransferase
MDHNIRPMEQKDLDKVRHWRNHPEIRKYMFSKNEILPEEHQKWFERTTQSKLKTLLIYTHRNQPMGFVQFSSNKSKNSFADWGFYTAPLAPKGTGTKMATLALDFAFEQLKAHKVFGEVLDYNTGSIKFHLKIGFIQEGVLRDHHYDENGYSSVYCFGLMHHEWIKKRNELPKHQ